MEYLEFIQGDKPNDKNNLFEGIDTSWNRVENGNAIGQLISSIINKYDFKNPSASIPDLVKAYQMIQNLKDEHWKAVKTEEIKEIIASCAGLFLESVAEQQSSVPDADIVLTLEA
jgi:hypothetical protein